MPLRAWMGPESEDIHFFDEGESVSSFYEVHAIGHKLAMKVLRTRPVLALSITAFEDPMLGSSSGLRADYPMDGATQTACQRQPPGWGEMEKRQRMQ